MRAPSSARNKTYRLQTTLLLVCARNRRAVRVPLRLFRARTADRVPEQGELREKPVRAPIRACRRPFPRRGCFPAAECSDCVLDARRAAGGDRRVSGRDLALAVPDAQAEDSHRLPRAAKSTTRTTSGGSAISGEPGRARPSTRPSTRHTAAPGSASTATSAIPPRAGGRGPATATTAGCRWTSASSASTAPELLRRKGTADRWTPVEQMWVAERAHRSGRGFYPWPNTARYCGLI